MAGIIGRIISSTFQALPRFVPPSQVGKSLNNSWTVAEQCNIMSVRTNVRYHFPHPNERKRIMRHGWVARMSTRSGRKVLMRRILKGCHVLSH